MKILRAARESQLFATFRSAVMMVGVTLFLVVLYALPGYPALAGDTLWLLFVLSLHPLAEHSATRLRHLGPLLVAAGAAVAGTEWIRLSEDVSPGTLSTSAAAITVATKVVWVAFLASGYYLFAHALLLWWAGVRVLEQLTDLASEPASPMAGPLLTHAVEGLQRALRYSTVLVVEPVSGGQANEFKCVAAAGRHSDLLLAAQRLTYDPVFLERHPERIGAFPLVMQSGYWYATNDAASDRYFRVVTELPDTISELAVPIKVDGQVVAVLAAEQRYGGAFGLLDKAIMRTAAGYLGPFVAEEEAVAYIRALGVRVFSRLDKPQPDLAGVMAEIARIATDVYRAERAILYRIEMGDKPKCDGPYIEGFAADAMPRGGSARALDHEPLVLVRRLLETPEQAIFYPSLQELRPEDILLPSSLDGDAAVSAPTWFEASSGVALRMSCPDGPVGVAFLYFLQPQRFGQAERARYQHFADLAAVAIAKASASSGIVEKVAGQIRGLGHRRGSIPGLTPRESEAARLVAEALSNKQIGAALSISESTVGNHLAQAYIKLGIKDGDNASKRVRLALRVQQLGLGRQT